MAAPTIVSINPAVGSALGGTIVVVTGTNLDIAGLAIAAGEGGGPLEPASSVTPLDATSAEFVMPAGAQGATVDVKVTTDHGNDTLADAFEYFQGPDSTGGAVAPTTAAPEVGGGTIEIVGTGFEDDAAGAATVLVDGVAATDVVVVDDEHITARAPAGRGTVDVQVSNANGSASWANAFTYDKAARSGLVQATLGSGRQHIRLQERTGSLTPSQGFTATGHERCLVLLFVGECDAAVQLDVHLEESDSPSSGFTAVTGAAFPTISEANDFDVLTAEVDVRARKPYLRAVGTQTGTGSVVWGVAFVPLRPKYSGSLTGMLEFSV